MNYFYQKIKTPIGSVNLVADDESILALIYNKNWDDFKTRYSGLKNENTALLKKAQKQLDEYFLGKRKTFDLPLRLEGTEFQVKVWQALEKIPFGKTCTYQEQATKIKNPKAVRAVGRTNGLNPISIFLPCHRVVGKSGHLTGYAGGLDAKEYLLNLEGAWPRQE